MKRLIGVFFVFSVFLHLTGISAPKSPQTLDFNLALFKKFIDSEPPKNIFISPISVFTALSILYNGADQATKRDMAKALNLGDLTLAELNDWFLNLHKSLASTKGANLYMANSLWIKKGIPFLKDFMDRAEKYFQAKTDYLTTPVPINHWVQKITHGKIALNLREIKPREILMIINAIYFKGAWAKQFDKKWTQAKDFHLGSGQTKKVQMMAQSGSYRYLEEKNLQIIRLPYKNHDIALYVFLPANLPAFYKILTPENLNNWLSRMFHQKGTIELPRFKMEYEKNLNAILTHLGFGTIFNPGQANFWKMVKKTAQTPEVYVSSVIHKSFVEVNEVGTEAAAITVIRVEATRAMPTRVKPFYMLVDRPFFFMIREDRSGNILFMGSIVNP